MRQERRECSQGTKGVFSGDKGGVSRGQKGMFPGDKCNEKEQPRSYQASFPTDRLLQNHSPLGKVTMIRSALK